MAGRGNISARAATETDKAACLWVESGAVKSGFYAMDVWDAFVKDDDGELTAAFYNGDLGGMGKFTRLYGEYAWLELLRVHPDFQGLGLGKAIYRRYMEQMSRLGLKSAGMYTGIGNHASRGLAERFGLSLRGEFCELLAAPGPVAGMAGFESVPAHSAEEIAAPFYNDMGSFIVINRTFYPVRQGLGALLGQMGWLYKNCEDIAVVGFRFQPEKAVHLAYASGDIGQAVSLASALARRHGSQKLSAARPVSGYKALEGLENACFERQAGTLVTLWLGL